MTTRLDFKAATTAAAVTAGLSLPLLASMQALSYVTVLAEVVTVVCFAVFALLPRNRVIICLAALAIVADAWLLTQASPAGSILYVTPALGLALGLAAGPLPSRPPPAVVIGASALLATLVAVAIVAGSDAGVAVGALVCVAGILIRLLQQPRPSTSRWASALSPALLLLTLGPVIAVGATTPRATWFGQLTYHGPRDGNLVALTFDDGPDDPFTLQIRDILDAHGVKATFFTVGKALDARPDISRALLADGQLLGDHSYYHTSTGWLRPAYPELRQTQDAFLRDLGVCPGFFRPPHGTHTPLMSRVVDGRGMRLVTWDVSAGDWATTDGDLVASRILKGVKPGSIILLHDGIDGTVTADRSVILQALPQILDGLAARGLKPVTLDVLLQRPGYVPC